MKSYAWLMIALFAAMAVASTGQQLVAQEPVPETESLDQQIKDETSALESEALGHVPVIVKVEYAIQTSLPPNLLVTAYGKVPTAGWSKVQLLRRIYVTPPSDGIWEYDLLALHPTGPVPQVESYVRASNTWKDFDQSVKGIRIYGIGRGAKEIKFGKQTGK